MIQLLEKQKAYFRTGSTLSVQYRIQALKKLYRAILKYEKEISAALYADLGKCASEGYFCEIGLTLSEIAHMIRHVKKYAKEERVRTPLAQFRAKSYKIKSPYGCVLIMSPWNYPFMLTIEPLADAIAAGNCVIVKPSAYSPATSDLISRMMAEIFPPEYVYTVTGGREENKSLLDLPLDKLFFTGSSAVGKEVLRKAAERLIPVTLELGGKSPCIVDETANIPLAAKRIVFGKFLNCGQTCVAPDFIYVHESVSDQLLNELKKQIGLQYGKEPLSQSDYGKIVNEKHFDRICNLIDKSKIFCGGNSDKSTLRIEPTVLCGVTWDDAVMREEIFGPVLPVLTYRTADELILLLNKKETPLAFYMFTAKKERAKFFLSRCSFGGGCINDTVIHLATSEMGFGGIGASGMGSYHGKAGFDCFTHEKSIVDKKTFPDLPLRYRPYSAKKDRWIKKFFKIKRNSNDPAVI